MPAGGTWQSQNKVRPGPYINVVGEPKALGSLGERGTVAMAMELGWGESLVRLSASDLLTGGSLLKLGVLSSEPTEQAKKLRLAFQGAAKAVIRRVNSNASKASIAVSTATVTAKYGGVFGNSILVKIGTKKATVEEEENVIVGVSIETYVGGKLKASSSCTDAASLEWELSNDWIDVSASALSDFAEGSYALRGGSNGSADSWTEVFSDLEQENWDTLAFAALDSTSKDAAVAFIKNMRERNGLKVQAVLTECSGFSGGSYQFTRYSPDYEGIYVCKQGYRLSDGNIVSPAEAVYLLAGLVAGAALTQSLTNTVIPNAVEILHPPKTGDSIEEDIQNGKLLLVKRRDGAIAIEYDINSFTSFTAKKGNVFSKGRPMRVLDSIANDIKRLFERSYLGKVSNNADGRSILKGDLLKYFGDLQKQGAVSNFDAGDIEILQGEDIDAVVVNCWVQPVDSMAKLYMVVNVRG